MILCSICFRKFTDRKSFSCHLTTAHKDFFENNLEKEKFLVNTLFGEEVVNTCLQDYIDEKFSAYHLPVDISKYLSLLGLKRTSKQERKTNRYRDAYLTAIQNKYGPDVTNISQVKQIQDKKKETVAKRYGNYDTYLQSCREKMKIGYHKYIQSERVATALSKRKKTCLEKYGHENFGCGKDAKSKAMATHRNTIDTWSYEERLARTASARDAVNHRGGYSSKIEKRVQKILIDLNVEALYNKTILNYNWDMVISNLILEIQGTMWHADPKKYKATDLIMGKILAKDIWDKDYRKKKKAEDAGYIVIEIWEDEINSKTDEELSFLVKTRLLENGYVF